MWRGCWSPTAALQRGMGPLAALCDRRPARCCWRCCRRCALGFARPDLPQPGLRPPCPPAPAPLDPPDADSSGPGSAGGRHGPLQRPVPGRPEIHRLPGRGGGHGGVLRQRTAAGRRARRLGQQRADGCRRHRRWLRRAAQPPRPQRLLPRGPGPAAHLQLLHLPGSHGRGGGGGGAHAAGLESRAAGGRRHGWSWCGGASGGVQ